MRVRKVLIGATTALIAVAVVAAGAVAVDYGTSIYAEYRLSTTVRKVAKLDSDMSNVSESVMDRFAQIMNEA